MAFLKNCLPLHTIHLTCQVLFSLKKKKKKCLVLHILLAVWRVNTGILQKMQEQSRQSTYILSLIVVSEHCRPRLDAEPVKFCPLAVVYILVVCWTSETSHMFGNGCQFDIYIPEQYLPPFAKLVIYQYINNKKEHSKCCLFSYTKVSDKM